MGCCCATRKYDDIDSTNNVETNTIDIQCGNNSNQNGVLLATPNQSNQNISHSNDIDDDDDDKDDDTQQLLSNNNRSNNIHNTNNNNYLSTGQSPPTPLINDTSYGQCQTPPILKTLFGGTSNLSDHMLDDDDMHDIHNNNNDNNDNNHITPMGGNVYMGFANNESPLLFPINQSHSDDMKSSNNSNDSNINRNSNSSSNCSKSYSNSSNQSNSGDWNVTKPVNNPSVLMGFVNNNETVSFNGSVNIINNMDHIQAINDEFDDNDNGDKMEETYIFSNRGKRMNVDSTLLFGNDNSQFTSSNFSLNSAQMADIVITDNIIRARSNISSSSLSSLGSSGSSGSNGTNASNMSLTSSKMQLLDELICDDKLIDNGNDYILISSFMISTFNVFIEYFPYKHIMEEIFLFCNIDINDPVFVHCNLDFEFPDTSELENKYNYYDIPDLYIENVSITNRKQPSLVLMIGAPGSGKTSYANYRYGKDNVIAADDYFDIYHNGQFIGSLLGSAHKYCQEEVLKRLYKLETVVVANTHSNYWMLYEKIIPVLFDNNLTHKIVFAVMPETNPTTLVRRCLHSCSKPKIIYYTQNIKTMLKRNGGNGINTDIILKYGQNKKQNDDDKYNNFDYGLWIDAESYHNLQDWFQNYTNTNLLRDLGDGRISPIIQESWQIFKKTFKKWLNLSKFNSENDPVIDLKVKIIGYSNHTICQMVNIDIIKPQNMDSMNNIFWNMFENGVNIDRMGIVLAMKKGIPFSNAKLLFDYNCIQYINDGPIIKAKLTTKRYVRNYIKYFTPPPLLNNNMITNQLQTNNIFFTLEGISTSHQLLNKNNKKQKLSDSHSFSLNVLEKHQNNNEKKQQFILNADATEFKMEINGNDSLNPTATEFQPQPIQQTAMQFIHHQLNNPTIIQQQQNWYSMQVPIQQNISWNVPLQSNNGNNNNNNNNSTATLNADATEFKMDENNDSLDPSANEFTPQQPLQFQQQQQQQQQMTMQLPMVQQQQQQSLQTQINQSPQAWDVPLGNNNNTNSFNPNATTFTPNITTNTIQQQPINTYNNISMINNNKTNPFNTISISEQSLVQQQQFQPQQIDYTNMAAYK